MLKSTNVRMSQFRGEKRVNYFNESNAFDLFQKARPYSLDILVKMDDDPSVLVDHKKLNFLSGVLY